MGSPHDVSVPLPPALAESTPYLLTRAVRFATRLAQVEFEGELLRFPHYATLCWVEHLGGCSQIALAAAMGIDPSDLVTVVRTLEGEGVLRRTTDPADRRRNLLELTDSGVTWLRRRHEQAQSYDDVLCAGLGDGGQALRDQLIGLVRREA